MKTSIIASMMFFLICCDTEHEEYQDPREASLLAVEYLSLDNNRYSLNLSEKAALEIGISKQNYYRMLDEVESANRQIQEWLKDPNANFTLTDPRNIEVQINDPQSVKTKSESYTPSGNIITNGQEVGTDSFFAYGGTKAVVFLCRSNAALTPIYNVTTKTEGQVRTGGGIGALGVNSSYRVQLAFSNVNAYLTFCTSDSNGGNAAWMASY